MKFTTFLSQIFPNRLSYENIKRNIFLSNLFSHSVLLVVSNIWPLALFPFLTNKLGVSSFGIYGLVLAYLAIADLIIGFAFRLTATDLLAKNSADHFYIGKLLIAVFSIKFLLFVCLTSLFLGLVKTGLVSMPKGVSVWLLMPFLLGSACSGFWIYHALQKVNRYTYFEIFFRTLFFFLTLYFVSSSADLPWALGFHAASYFLISATSLFWVLRHIDFHFVRPEFHFFKTVFLHSFIIFLSQLPVALYSSINAIFLGKFGDSTSLGLFVICEKLYRLLGSVSVPINKTAFPRLSELSKIADKEFWPYLKKIVVLLLILYAAISLLLNVFSFQILSFFVQEDKLVQRASSLLFIFSFSLPIFALNSLGTYVIVARGLKTKLLWINIFAGLANLIALWPAYNLAGLIGIGWLIFVVNSFIFFSYFWAIAQSREPG